MARRRSALSQFRRSLYVTQRTIGDYEALSRSPGRYVRRRARRSVTRSLMRALWGN